MRMRALPTLLATLALAAITPITSASAQGTGVSACVGAAIGCTQADFIITAPALSTPLTINSFTLTLASGYRFADPLAPYLEIEDSIGFTLADATINGSLTVLSGVFPAGFEAVLNPTLRIRTEFLGSSVVPGFTPGATFSALGVTGAPVLSMTIAPSALPGLPNTSVPEPATIALVATGLVSLGAVARRRRTAA